MLHIVIYWGMLQNEECYIVGNVTYWRMLHNEECYILTFDSQLVWIS